MVTKAYQLFPVDTDLGINRKIIAKGHEEISGGGEIMAFIHVQSCQWP